MIDHLPRYKVIPQLTDTAGFFDYSVPYTKQPGPKAGDSLQPYYDFSIYDYRMPAPAKLELQQTASVFKGHLLLPSSGGPSLIHRQSSDWITGIILICLILLAWIQTVYSKRLRQIVRSVALPYYVNQLEREGNLYNERISLGLSFIYLCSLSLLIYSIVISQVSEFLQVSGLLLFLIISGIVLGLSLVKTIVSLAAGIIFKTGDYAHAYRLNSLIFNHTTGLIIFPAVTLIAYWEQPIIIWISAIVLAILLIYRFIRSFSIGLSNSKFSVFYLILYLCTLEILPLLLLVKAIRQF